jgi:antitoxin component YwqK of YwqJK toxin-antitoxin module
MHYASFFIFTIIKYLMKKILTALTLMFLFNLKAQGQYTDTVFQYFDKEWKQVDKNKDFTYFRIALKLPDSTWHVKDYYATGRKLQMEGIYLDDSFKVKDGKFYYYHYNGNVEKECTYNKGKYVGLYRAYSHDGVLLDSARYKSTGIPFHKAYSWDGKGNLRVYAEYDMEGKGTGYMTAWWRDSVVSEFGKYSEGHLKDSVWTYYHRNGQVSMTERFDAGKVLEYTCYDTKGNIMTDCDTAVHMPEAGYAVNVYLAKNIRMPYEAKEGALLGNNLVLIGFVVDTDGRLIDFEAQNNTYEFFIKEALRVAKMLPVWKPGRHKNRNVPTFYTQPINFRLE